MTATEQRTLALSLANEVRCENAATMRRISQGSFDEGVDVLVDILTNADPTEPVGAIPIYRLLCAPRGMGDVRVRKLLVVAGVISGDRKLRELTDRQRGVLAHHLTHRHLLWPWSGRRAAA